jgi:capsular exopolysaccharide synthesis family protein
VPRDGKSVTALNTALILSEIRHLKTLVVDGDFRRGSLAGMLNLAESPGLADVLQGQATYEEAVQETPVPNLFFMPAGHTQGRSAAEVLSDETTGSVFARFRDEYNYTIVDTPPATTVTDVGVIGQWCNGVIMVVRVNRTPEPIAQRAVRVLQVNNVAILGVLLVGDEARAPGYGYYRYYNYYRYYSSGGSRGR